MMQKSPLLRKRLKRRKQAKRIRTALILLFTFLIASGIASVAGALGGLAYEMPPREGVKQILLGGIALGIGLGGRYALG